MVWQLTKDTMEVFSEYSHPLSFSLIRMNGWFFRLIQLPGKYGLQRLWRKVFISL